MILAHQADMEDSRNLVSLERHAERWSQLLGWPRRVIDGNGGPAAIQRIRESLAGDRLLVN